MGRTPRMNEEEDADVSNRGVEDAKQEVSAQDRDAELQALIEQASTQPGVRELLQLTEMAATVYASTLPEPFYWDSSSTR